MTKEDLRKEWKSVKRGIIADLEGTGATMYAEYLEDKLIELRNKTIDLCIEKMKEIASSYANADIMEDPEIIKIFESLKDNQ